jgi:hypothetical protein
MPICFCNFNSNIMRMGLDFRFHVLGDFMYAMGFMGFRGFNDRNDSANTRFCLGFRSLVENKLSI